MAPDREAGPRGRNQRQAGAREAREGHQSEPSVATPDAIQPISLVASRVSGRSFFSRRGRLTRGRGASMRGSVRRRPWKVSNRQFAGRRPSFRRRRRLTDMMRSMRPSPILGVTAGLLALPAFAACSTQEIRRHPVVIPDRMPSADHGELMIRLRPSEVSFEEQQASAAAPPTSFYAFLDGRQLVWSSTVTDRRARSSSSRGARPAHRLPPAGSHHFEIRAAGGGPTVFAGDGEIAAGSRTQLYLFGPAGARPGAFRVVSRGRGGRQRRMSF